MNFDFKWAFWTDITNYGPNWFFTEEILCIENFFHNMKLYTIMALDKWVKKEAKEKKCHGKFKGNSEVPF